MIPREILRNGLFAVVAVFSIGAVNAAVPPAALTKGTVVRLEGTGIEAGWHEGKITVTSEGCTMAALVKPTKEGYTMIALVAMARLQRQAGGAWQDLPLKDLLTREPKACLEGAD